MYLGIPTTSAQCEPLFSEAGKVLTEKRTSMKHEMAEIITFSPLQQKKFEWSNKCNINCKDN